MKESKLKKDRETKAKNEKEAKRKRSVDRVQGRWGIGTQRKKER